MAYTPKAIGIIVMFSLFLLGLGVASIYFHKGKQHSPGTDAESASASPLVPFDISKHSSYRHDHSQLADHQTQINAWITDNNLNSSDVYIGSTAFANEATRTLHFTHYAYMHIDHLTANGDAVGDALSLIRISTVERPDLVEWHPAGVPRTTDIPRSAAAATASSAVRMSGGASASSFWLPSRPRSARLRQPSPTETEDQFELQDLSDRLPSSSSRSVRR